MQLYHHYFGAWRNCFLDYDFLHVVDGRPELEVRFTRFKDVTPDIAETTLPDCTHWQATGFNEEELSRIKAFLADNRDAIMKEAEKTIGKDADLEVISFELDESAWRQFSEKCYLSGVSPEIGFEKLLEEAINELKTRK